MPTAKIANAANTTPQLIRKGATCICEVAITNLTTTICYLKLWDRAKASDVTPGTTPPDLVLPIPPSNAAPFIMAAEVEADFQLGLVWAVTTGVGDADNTPASARDVVGTLSYDILGG